MTRAGKTVLGLAILAEAALLALPNTAQRPTWAQSPAASYVYFPSASAVDGRMLGVGNIGSRTLAGNLLRIRVAIPATDVNGNPTTSFKLGVFDGDTSPGFGAGAGNWDNTGGVPADACGVNFTLQADPTGGGSNPIDLVAGGLTWNGNEDLSNVAGNGTVWTATANAMLNNGWWEATIATSPEARGNGGNYFYQLLVEMDPDSDNLVGSPVPALTTVVSNFKLRTTGTLNIQTVDNSAPIILGFEHSNRSFVEDAKIVFPGWNGSFADSQFFLNAVNTGQVTNDGSSSFYLSVPPTASNSLVIWDGDFDVGDQWATAVPSGVAIPGVKDTADANPDNAPPAWSLNRLLPNGEYAARTEGAAYSLNPGDGDGDPNDDAIHDALRRRPPTNVPGVAGVCYSVTDPAGRVYTNLNPSGNREWERFVPSVPTIGGRLPAGTYRVDVKGLDMNNLSFWGFFHATLAVTPDGEPVPAITPSGAAAGTGTPGYWKNHPEAWPLDFVTIGDGPWSKTYSKAEAIAIMKREDKSDVSQKMVYHLIPAMLNVALGNNSGMVSPWIAAAQTWMGSHPFGSNVKSSTPDGAQGIVIKDKLDAYNNGHLGAPHRG